jgi:hypothetical protein
MCFKLWAFSSSVSKLWARVAARVAARFDAILGFVILAYLWAE